MVKVTPINQTVRTLQALRPEIRIALQHAARNPLIRTRVEQIREWTEVISGNLKIDLDQAEIKNRLIPKDALNLERGFDMDCATHRYSAHAETLRFLSEKTSVAFSHFPRPKDHEQFYRLAQQVCGAFYAVIAASASGLGSEDGLTEAQDTIINAFNELRQPR